MNSTTTPQNETRCLRCGRRIKSGTYGRTCAAKVRAAAKTADLTAWTPAQAEAARELIEDGGVVPSNREGVFFTVSTDGTEIHRTSVNGCNCTNGLLTHPSRPCLHRCAVAIVLATQAPAVTVPAPRQPIALPSSDAMWAELDRLTDAFMAIG